MTFRGKERQSCPGSEGYPCPSPLVCEIAVVSGVGRVTDAPLPFKASVSPVGRIARRLAAGAAPAFDEFLVLRYRATNEPPYSFEWVNYKDARLDYAGALARINSRYQQRF